MKKKEDKEIPKEIKKDGKEIRGIVRIAGKDLRGDLPIKRAMSKIKGVGIRTGGVLSEIIFKEFSMLETSVVGELDDGQIEKIEQIISNPVRFGVPKYMVNRRKDRETGEDRHMIGTDLTFSVKQDVEREKNMNTWRGYRHAYGQKVRGQRTRSTGRTGMSVGVLRKSVLAKTGASAQPGASAPSKKEEKKEK